jgi:hypothetical protein
MWLRTQGGNKEELGSLGVSWGKQGREGPNYPAPKCPAHTGVPSTAAKTLVNFQGSESPECKFYMLVIPRLS